MSPFLPPRTALQPGLLPELWPWRRQGRRSRAGRTRAARQAFPEVLVKPRKIEELLETVFTEREQGRDEMQSVLAHAYEGHAPDKAPGDFGELESMGLVSVQGTRVTLTAQGEQRAALVVRRHRLAERLFSDLLALDDAHTEQQACEFEHVLSEEATDSVCTLLGHPPACPHGKPIPSGACCAAFTVNVKPLVTGLAALPLGGRGRIVFVAPRWADRMDR